MPAPRLLRCAPGTVTAAFTRCLLSSEEKMIEYGTEKKKEAEEGEEGEGVRIISSH